MKRIILFFLILFSCPSFAFNADATIVNMEGYDIKLPAPATLAIIETPVMDTVARYSGQGILALVYDGLKATEEDFKEMCKLMGSRQAFEVMGVPSGTDLIEEYRTENLQIISFNPNNSFSKRNYQLYIFIQPIMFNIGCVAFNEAKMSDMDILALLLHWGKSIISNNSNITKEKKGDNIIKIGETDMTIPTPHHFKRSTTAQKDSVLHFSLAPGETEDSFEFGFTTKTIASNPYLSGRSFTEQEYIDLIQDAKSNLPKSLPTPIKMENLPMTPIKINASGNISMEQMDIPNYEKMGIFFYHGVFEGNAKDISIEWKYEMYSCIAFIHVKSKVLMIRIYESRKNNDFARFSSNVISWLDAILAANE